MGLRSWLRKRRWFQEVRAPLKKQFPAFARDRPEQFRRLVLASMDLRERIRDPQKEIDVLGCRTLEEWVVGRVLLDAKYHKYYKRAEAYTMHNPT